MHVSIQKYDQSLLPFAPLPCIHTQKNKQTEFEQKLWLDFSFIFLINIHHVTKFPEQITFEFSIKSRCLSLSSINIIYKNLS